MRGTRPLSPARFSQVLDRRALLIIPSPPVFGAIYVSREKHFRKTDLTRWVHTLETQTFQHKPVPYSFIHDIEFRHWSA